MMGVTKFQQFINRLSGGGLTAVQAEALLTPEVAGAFADALTWSSTRKQLQRSPAFVETLANSETLLGLFLQDKGLWAGLVEFPLSAQAVATNARALDQIQQHPWAWEKALLREYFYSSLLEDTTALAHLTPTSIVKDTLLWPLAYSNSVSRDWLLADDAQAIPIFDDSAAWSKVRNIGLTMNVFCQNTTALTHALDTNPARLRNGIETIRASALSQSSAVPIIRTHPNRNDAVPRTDRLTRKYLAKKHHRDFKFVADSGNNNYGYFTCFDSQGSVLWKVPYETIVHYTTLPNNVGFVVEKEASLDDSTSYVQSVFEGYLWPANVNDPATKQWRAEASFSNNKKCSLSPNGRYLLTVSGYNVFLYDTTTDTVLVDGNYSAVMPTSSRSFCVTDDGKIVIGFQSGYYRVYDSTMTQLTNQRANSIASHVDCVGINGSGELVIGYYSNNTVCIVDLTDYSVDRTLTLPSAENIEHGGFLQKPNGGFYLLTSSNPYVFSYDAQETLLGNSTNSYTNVGAGRRTLYVNDQNELMINNNQFETIVSEDGSVSTTQKIHKLSDYAGFGFVGHPTYPYAIGYAPHGGVAPFDGSEAQIESGYTPISSLKNQVLLSPGSGFNGDHFVAVSEGHFHLYDQETGELVGGYPPPCDTGADSTLNRRYISRPYSDVFRLMADHTRLYGGYSNSTSYPICVYDKDGVKLHQFTRSDSGSTGSDITLLANGLVLLAADSYLVFYDPTDGSLVSQGGVGAGHGNRLVTAFSNRVFTMPNLGVTYTSYLRCAKENGDGLEYIGNSTTHFRPYTSYNALGNAIFADGYFVGVIRQTNASGWTLRMSKYDDTSGLFNNQNLEIPDTWFASVNAAILSFTFSLAYNPDNDCLYLCSENTVLVLANWKAGEAGVYVAQTITLPNPTYILRTHGIQGNYPNPLIGDW